MVYTHSGIPPHLRQHPHGYIHDGWMPRVPPAPLRGIISPPRNPANSDAPTARRTWLYSKITENRSGVRGLDKERRLRRTTPSMSASPLPSHLIHSSQEYDDS